MRDLVHICENVSINGAFHDGVHEIKTKLEKEENISRP